MYFELQIFLYSMNFIAIAQFVLSGKTEDNKNIWYRNMFSQTGE